ncbi:MAG TPA: type IV pili methyl-accepting chemotaxis transducer N-terminal domain-containing protein [Rectinemataceae bacterium]|nr:type IV pili methyl-accepting chemotaxis transducer N-terminal domain-containing protein [Rectinemataceae bacterium]
MATGDSGDPARYLRKRYALALSFIALLGIASQAIIQFALAQNDDAGRVVNIAGRQRMLSQKIAKTSLEIGLAKPGLRAPYIAELDEAVALWSASHDALLFGSPEMGTKGRNSPTILRLFRAIEPSYHTIIDAAHRLRDRAADSRATGPELGALIEPIVANEDGFLEGMDAITFQYDKETGERVAFTRLLEATLLVVMFGVLALELFFIFIPGEKRIIGYFNDLDKALRQNKDLLRELQHRVKNTLAMISGIVSYTRETQASQEAIAALDGLLARVDSVSDLYSLLYSNASHSEVRLDDYLAKIVGRIGAMSNGISVESKTEPLVLEAGKAAPFGIIATELITNAIKYAFPRGRRGKILLSLRKTATGAELEVRDDGIGPPPDFSSPDRSGTGLLLVSELATQIGGDFRAEPAHPGMRCVVAFAVSPTPAG